MSGKARVLIGSPIRQSPLILSRFLQTLETMNQSSLAVDYYFIDDNDDTQSKELLKKFGKSIGNPVFIEEPSAKDIYVKNETTHYWNNYLIWKVAAFKNRIIKYCKEKDYDYLFLIDSDLVLSQTTLEHLISADKNIISEIFWTKWQPNTEPMPQVWLYDQYSFSDKNTYLDSAMKYLGFREQLRVPGIYKVGGLGACTLIDREALEKGVNFEQIYNISFCGEDRHFCIRAAALGLELYVDTCYPALHIYRDEDLDKVEDYINTCQNTKTPPLSLLQSDLFATEFLNQFFTYDSLTKPYLCGVNFLSEEYQRIVYKNRQEITKYLSENKAICRIANCRSVNITEKDDFQEINTVFSVISEKDGVATEKEIHCDLTIRKDYETLWKVYKIKLTDSNENAIYGFNVMDLLDSIK